MFFSKAGWDGQKHTKMKKIESVDFDKYHDQFHIIIYHLLHIFLSSDWRLWHIKTL